MHGILAGLADLVFPPRCLTCGLVLEEHASLPFCPACTAGIRTIRSPLCVRCGVPLPDPGVRDRFCGDCLRTARPFAAARAVGCYESTLLEAIHLFKYRGRLGIGKVLGSLMADCAGRLWDMTLFTRILPVPLHRRRLQERGFNQAVILARQVARRFSLPLDLRSLKRAVGTVPQVGLGRAQRTANVQGVFTVRLPDTIRGQRILLIDDVYTTGSTLTECATVLMKAGADAVAVLTLARALPGQGAADGDGASADPLS